MKSLIFKFVAVCIIAFPASATAQQTADDTSTTPSQQQDKVCCKSQMNLLIDESLKKIKPDLAETVVKCVAEMERIKTMFPDSVAPKRQIALQSLTFAVQNPQDKKTQEMINKAQENISEMEKMPAADVSDLCMLRGFLYTTIIVQDPMKNGPQYYRDVIENFEKALKVNPDNKLARELYERFKEGMRGAR